MACLSVRDGNMIETSITQFALANIPVWQRILASALAGKRGMSQRLDSRRWTVVALRVLDLVSEPQKQKRHSDPVGWASLEEFSDSIVTFGGNTMLVQAQLELTGAIPEHRPIACTLQPISL